MKKISDLWSQFSYEIRSMLLKYPGSVTVIAVLTILSIIFIDTDDGIILEVIIPFLCYFGIGLFFSESSCYGKFKKKIISISGLAVISAILVYKQQEYDNLDIFLPNDSWLIRIIITYITVFLICGIYHCYKRSGYFLPQYAIKVFSNLIKIHIIYFILTIGALIVSTIIIVLFVNDSYYFDNFNIIGRMMLLVFGLFYVPAWIYSCSQVESKLEVFTKILVKYVLFSLTILIFGIIYIYILKILIMRDIPSNQIFSILTGSFFIAMPTWTMLEAIDERTFFRKISTKLPLLFVPLILLQIYSISARIIEYGVTPDRYMGVMWIILEIIYLLIYWRKHRYVGKMFIIAAFSIIIALLAPIFNMYHMSAVSQEKILSHYKKDKNLSSEMKQKIYGAYEYLSSLDNSEKYIDNKYTSEEIKEISGFYNEYDDKNNAYSSELYISIEKKINDINIDGFSRMQVVEYEEKCDDSVMDISNLLLTEYQSENKIRTVDLKELINGYIKYGLEHVKKEEYSVYIDSYYMNHCQIKLDEDTLLVIRNFNIYYDKGIKEIKDLSLLGYLFQKKKE